MAGGEGRRLRPVTGENPKPMVSLAGKPVLEHILRLLQGCGITEVCMSLRYRPEAIISYFGNGQRLGMRIGYHIESKPLGTAGGVRACLDPGDRRSVLVISGDCVCDFNLRELIEAHFRHRADATLALYPESTPLRYGVVLTDFHGRVVSFAEKPGWEQVVSDMINTGIYVLSPSALSLIPEGRAFDFSSELFPLMLSRGSEIRALPMTGYWSDIGTPRAYYQTCIDAIDGKIQLPSLEASAAVSVAKEHKLPVFSQASGSRELHFPDRARAMRLVSQFFMEAGADFSDGLRLDTAEGKIHIAPSGGRDCIIVEATDSGGAPSAPLAAKYAGLVKKLGKSV